MTRPSNLDWCRHSGCGEWVLAGTHFCAEHQGDRPAEAARNAAIRGEPATPRRWNQETPRKEFRDDDDD